MSSEKEEYFTGKLTQEQFRSAALRLETVSQQVEGASAWHWERTKVAPSIFGGFN